MVYNRKATAPWSVQREAGIESATVDSTIEVPQYLQPVVNTGEIGKDGNWRGITTSDKTFLIDPEHLAIPNSASVLSPQKSDHEYIDMTGFSKLFIALKVSNGGNFGLRAVMGPETYPFANLSPVNAAATLRGTVAQSFPVDIEDLFNEGGEPMTADVWNIFEITTLNNQKLLQILIINSSGAESNIQFASLRVV